MLIFAEVLGIIILFVAAVALLTGYLDKRIKRQMVALGAVAVLAFLINVGAMIYDTAVSGSKNAFDYCITLVRGLQNTMSLLVFDDKFSSLGVLTHHIWFKGLYYAVLGIAYVLYSLTLISLISYKLLSKIKLLVWRKKEIFAFTCLNEKSVMLANSIRASRPKAAIAFTLDSFTQTDDNKKLLRKLKDARHNLYVGGKETGKNSFLARFPLLELYKKISVFCLDDNSEKNIAFCKNYSDDRIQIYALTEEEYSGSQYLHKNNVHVVKQHDLTARMLCQTHPCYLSAYDGESSKEINVIIIGRGRSGNEIFKNIYIANQFENIKLKITVFDSQDKNGFYRLRYPELYDNENISFLQANIYSENFFKDLKSHLRDNNYIVVAIGDDKKNIEFANILYEAISARTECGAQIYAHVRHEQNKTLLQSLSSFSSMGEDSDKSVSVEAFGHESHVFDYNIVVAEFMDIFAKAINDNYNKANPSSAKQWEELSEFTKSSNRAVGLAVNAKMFSLGCEIVSSDDGREEVDLNKLSPEDDLRAAKEEHMRWCAFHAVNGWTKMEIDESKAKSRDGKKLRKIEEKKRSLSMVSWDELEAVSRYLGEDIQSYDYLWKDAVVYALHKVGKKIVPRTQE